VTEELTRLMTSDVQRYRCDCGTVAHPEQACAGCGLTRTFRLTTTDVEALRREYHRLPTRAGRPRKPQSYTLDQLRAMAGLT